MYPLPNYINTILIDVNGNWEWHRDLIMKCRSRKDFNVRIDKKPARHSSRYKIASHKRNSNGEGYCSSFTFLNLTLIDLICYHIFILPVSNHFCFRHLCTQCKSDLLHIRSLYIMTVDWAINWKQRFNSSPHLSQVNHPVHKRNKSQWNDHNTILLSSI